MARSLRIEYPGAVWYVMHRGNDRQDIFCSDQDHLLFEIDACRSSPAFRLDPSRVHVDDELGVSGRDCVHDG
jgi:hypothetical protein